MEVIMNGLKDQVKQQNIIICSKKFSDTCYVLDTPDKFMPSRRTCLECRKWYNHKQ